MDKSKIRIVILIWILSWIADYGILNSRYVSENKQFTALHLVIFGVTGPILAVPFGGIIGIAYLSDVCLFRCGGQQ